MPNPFINSDFDDEDASSGDDNLSFLGFHPDDGESEEKGESDFVLGGDNIVSGRTGAGEPAGLSFGDESAKEDEDDNLPNDEEDDQSVDEEDDGEELAGEDDDLEEDEEDDDGEGISAEDSVVISKSQLVAARQLINSIEKNTTRLNSLLSGLLSDEEEEKISVAQIDEGILSNMAGQVIEGVFNGENMIGSDGKEYSVPANYASKSKLVEGDMLKLTITDRGTFVYKQTKPVERKRLIGKLEKDENGNYIVVADHKKYGVLTASITYYKGVAGDKVVILVPIAGDSAWGAVENVIKSK
jgi:hypothetical protein